jgi:hypothetical protein
VRTRRPRVGPAHSRDYLLAIAAGLVVGMALGSTLPLPLLLLLMLSFLADRRPRRISTVQIVSTAVAVFAGAVTGYQLYRTLWALPDIRLFPVHQISLVCPPGEYPSFNIMLEFGNFGAKLGVL